jgi:hypothetical protein
MRNLLLVTACVLLSGCLGVTAKVAPQVLPVEKVVNSDCYTVDLFTKTKVEKPATDVPEANRQFLGKWGGGAWNDVWCHDLLVTKVYADGRADLVDMHAPYEDWNQPATAFRRVGRIDSEGNLRFAYGTERLSYRIESGKLVGTRSGMLGNLKVELARRGVPPIPTPNPIRLSQLAAKAPPGT